MSTLITDVALVGAGILVGTVFGAKLVSVTTTELKTLEAELKAFISAELAKIKL